MRHEACHKITFAYRFNSGPFAVFPASQFADFGDAFWRVGNSGGRQSPESRLTNKSHNGRILELPANHFGVGHFTRMTAITSYEVKYGWGKENAMKERGGV